MMIKLSIGNILSIMQIMPILEKKIDWCVSADI